MKKQLLTLLAMVTIMTIPLQMKADDIPINETNFPDANFRNWVLAQDYGKDGVLTEDEIASVLIIAVNNKGISNLKGIEFFTKLTVLNCSENSQYGSHLTSLDVSKNTALRNLYCNKNELSSLDVSGCIELTYLDCSWNNLTSLDVSNNVALEHLNCSINQLASLVMPICTTLNYLDCGGNQLTELDVSMYVALKNLYCGDNQLTKLDVSKNTALWQFRCGGNSLTSLDVTNNTALDDLVCNDNMLTSLDVSKNTLLIWLYCYNNHLTSLNISKNLVLKDLRCYSNQLTSLEVSKNSALKELRCYNNRINETEMGKLVENLPAVTKGYLIVKDLQNADEQNVITTTQVATANAKGWTVYAYKEGGSVVYDGSDPTTPIGVAINPTNFPDNTFLTWVKYYDKNSDDVLSEAEIAAVTYIEISDRGITTLKGIEYFTALTDLACNGNNLNSLDVSKNTALKSLYCEHNQLTSLDVTKNTALVKLLCSHNLLTSLDVTKNTLLEDLLCNGNKLTSLDVSKNTLLEVLYCDNNHLTKIDVSKNTSLYRLECNDNMLTSLDVSKNTKLEKVQCNSNRINETEMGKLVQSLPTVGSGSFYVRDLSDANEQNVITAAQAAAARAKGWRVKAYDGNDWKDYLNDSQTLNPLDNTNFGSDINGATDLDGNVVGNIYYNISSGNGEYNVAEGCIVVTKPTDDSVVNGQDIFGEDFKDNYTGIVFKVPAGKGSIKVEAQTTGNMMIKVKIGNSEPFEMMLQGKPNISVPYNVTEPTYVYIYGSSYSAAPGLMGASSATGELKLYSIEVAQDGTRISSIENGELTIDNYYTLDGRMLQGKPTQKGIYIINGHKVVIK